MTHNFSDARPFMLSPFVHACVAALLLSACSGGSSGSGSSGSSDNSAGNNAVSIGQAGAAPPTLLSCPSLARAAVPAANIGLPTGGAKVIEATSLPASVQKGTPSGARCALRGEIAPVDPAAPNIRFSLHLPEEWNGKLLMFGGGAYDGTLPPPDGDIPAAPLFRPTPVGRGYATLTTDSGHQTAAPDGVDASFAVNDEALRNYSGDALKKVRDAAIFLLALRYAAVPQKSYFVGGSNGGREALTVVQRWPQEWDGAIAFYPAWNFTAMNLQFLRVARAFARPGAWVEPTTRRLLLNAAVTTCDAYDNVLDGLVSNIDACNSLFDPSTASVNGAPLRCPGGGPRDANCLSDVQIAALKTSATPLALTYALAGDTQYPGFNTWISDLDAYTFGTAPPASPMPPNAPFGSRFADQWARYFVARRADFNSLALDPEQPGPWLDRIAALATQDALQLDLSAFQARGGKLLMAHGTADAAVSPRASAQYYERVRAVMGTAITDTFFRYYQIPGYGHGSGSQFNAAWDSLAALEDWAERGRVPFAQVVVDTTGVPGRSRPLCEYPSWPKYLGTGDANLATSFVCTVQ